MSVHKRLTSTLGALYARAPGGIKLGLGPMQEACARAGHPEARVPYVHIAGTNGKGSVCALLESTARAAGFRTAMFTSPHLARFAERIQINGEPVGDDALSDALERAMAIGAELTFFEVATLAAFLIFAEAECTFGILEVGLGGRLDATNVLTAPRATAITSIAFDHMQYLGYSLREIAQEKAGILKPEVPFVLGEMPGEAEAAIREVAVRIGASEAPRDAAGIANPGHLARKMPWLQNTSNAEVAATLAGLLGLADAVPTGFAAARWPGRMELLELSDGAYLLDGAHNEHGAQRFARDMVAARQPQPPWPELGRFHAAQTALVFGALADKDWPPMLDAVAPYFSHIVYTTPKGRAAVNLHALSARRAGAHADAPAEALAVARALVGRDGLVAVIGSLHLVGECRASLLDLPCDPPIAL